jgi:hypothetical protein
LILSETCPPLAASFSSDIFIFLDETAKGAVKLKRAQNKNKATKVLY